MKRCLKMYECECVHVVEVTFFIVVNCNCNTFRFKKTKQKNTGNHVAETIKKGKKFVRSRRANKKNIFFYLKLYSFRKNNILADTKEKEWIKIYS